MIEKIIEELEKRYNVKCEYDKESYNLHIIMPYNFHYRMDMYDILHSHMINYDMDWLVDDIGRIIKKDFSNKILDKK